MFQNSYEIVKIRELTYELDIMPGSPPRHEILGIIS
jgi:NADH:ubiquinone oxidoreductase subunit B-like Fe-S oxidoreductase